MNNEEQKAFEEYLLSHGVPLSNVSENIDLKKLSFEEAKSKFNIVKGLVDSINSGSGNLRREIKGD